jgi:hypothetical protein
MKICLFAKNTKTDKTLIRLSKIKKRIPDIIKIRDEREYIITNLADILRE